MSVTLLMLMLRSLSVMALVASTAGLTLPPSTRTYKQPLGVIRESIAHLMDPDGFVAERIYSWRGKAAHAAYERSSSSGYPKVN